MSCPHWQKRPSQTVGRDTCNNQKIGVAVRTVLIEIDRARVARRDFPELGDCAGWHRHEHDYVVVPLFDGDFRIENGKETVISSLTTSGSYFGQASIEHDVCNGNSGACSFIEIELFGANPRGCLCQWRSARR